MRCCDWSSDVCSSDLTFTYYHCSNSAGIIDLEEANMDIVRAGITTYGMYQIGRASCRERV